MSDGDNATPGQHRAPGSDGDNQWLTRIPRPLPGAAPWERASDGSSESSPAPVTPRAQRGSHTGGITVADLFAKVTGDIPASLQQSSSSDEDDDDELHDWPEDAEDADGAVEVAETEAPTVPTPSAYASQIPDLTRQAPAPAPTTILAKVTAPAARAPKRRRRSVLLAGRSIAAVFAVLALVLTGGAWQWTSSKNNRLNTIAALDPNSRDIVDPKAQFGDENFLIVGVDSRYGENSDMGAGNTEDAGGARSDSVILVNIPASRKRVVAVSFPRDLAITPMQCEAWDASNGKYGPVYDEETGTYGPDQVYTETKLNSAYSFGGPKCLVKVIQKISGLSINRFMAVDFAGFAKMVDALGGVEVCSTTPLEDYELGTVLANAGRQTIDGTTALNYVRARQVTTEVNGDYGRIKRQQMFLSSLLRSMISKDTFFNIGKLNNVVNLFINDSSVDNVTTKDLVQLGQSIQGVSAGRVTFVTVPTGVTDSEGNEPPRVDDMRALFDAIINDDPLPEERNADKTPVPSTSSAPSTNAAAPDGEDVNTTTTDPSQVTVRVSNSTGQDGLAATATKELEQHGFTVNSPDDYQGQVTSTTVFYSPGHEQAAATVASTLPGAHVERVSGLGDVVRVVLGTDFTAVGTPAASGSAAQMRVTHGSLSGEPTKLPEDLSITNAADTTCK